MRLVSGLKMKWLVPSAEASKGLLFRTANHCAFFVRDQRTGGCEGITVFEPRDFDLNFVVRLQKRLSVPVPGKQFVLQVPEFIRHRIDSLIGPEVKEKLEVIISPFLYVRSEGHSFVVRSKMNVVNVDDSPVILKLLKHILGGVGFVENILQTSDSSVAAEFILKHDPDVVTMDIQMPEKTGVQVVQEVLKARYVPILMVSSVSLEEGTLVFSALREGAFDYLQKPKAEDKSEFAELMKEKLLHGAVSERKTPALPPKRKFSQERRVFDKNLIWCIGSSTGGTQALTEILTSLPTEIPAILVVQHIPPVFSRAFAASTNELVPFLVKESSNGEPVQPNTVYIAPGGAQMSAEMSGGVLRIVISDAPPVNRFKPSVDFLFESVAKLKGFRIVAGILTGMGKDGAQGLLKLKESGAFTFAQDEATSTVYGMPRAAAEIGAAKKIVPLGEVAEVLVSGNQFFSKTG